MKVDVLISTMCQVDFSLLDKMKVSSDCVVVNQCGADGVNEFEYVGNRVKWINSSEKGLSRSRNLAIEGSIADICLIADDDMVYLEGYADRVSREFESRKDADIIAFIVDGMGRPFKSYPKSVKKLNFFSAMRVSSVQIAFRRERLISSGVNFKVEFGAGSIFYAGEENIFLSECLRRGLKLYFVPVKIADIYLGESTWFEGFNDRYFFTKGATFAAMSRSLSAILILQFAFRKRSLYRGTFSMVQVLKMMLRGRKSYLDESYR